MKQEKTPMNHWQFSLAVYMQDDVAQHCLALQRSVGLDVNVLLLMLWAAGQWGYAPTTQQIADADSTICAWRDEVILPLRLVRTRLKTGPAPAPDATTNGLRENIKRLELDAERMQQDRLAHWVRSQLPVPPATRRAHSLVTAQVTGTTAMSAAEGAGSTRQPVAAATGAGKPTAGNMTDNTTNLAVLEQTAVRVVAYYAGQTRQGSTIEASEKAADPWLALQHAHQIVVAAASVS